MGIFSFAGYIANLTTAAQDINIVAIQGLAESLRLAWKEGKQVFLCGNGGSAANALHIANDLLYGIAKNRGVGMRATALSANQSVITCLANDLSYEDIFSHQLELFGKTGDILIALSGSGNSKNIVKAIITAKKMNMKTFAILGYSGGECLRLADVPIHIPIHDMQIAEDIQVVIGHMLMQWLWNNSIYSSGD